MSQVDSPLPDAATLAAFHADGAAVLRGVLPLAWVERLRAATERVLAQPSANGLEFAAGGPGRFYGDYFLWLTDPDVRALVFDSPLADLAQALMGSATVDFFYDQLLVKEPGTEKRTPWHHDIPYWPIRGEQVVSLWVPLDPASPANGVVTYVKGSHRWGQWYRPATFTGATKFDHLYAAGGLPPVPDIDAEADRHEFLAWSLEPGDVIAHHPLVVHGAPGNASADQRRRAIALHFTGDDVVYDPRPGTFLESPGLRERLPPVGLAPGDALAGPLFPRVRPR